MDAPVWRFIPQKRQRIAVALISSPQNGQTLVSGSDGGSRVSSWVLKEGISISEPHFLHFPRLPAKLSGTESLALHWVQVNAIILTAFLSEHAAAMPRADYELPIEPIMIVMQGL
jgi:hypothetical protein